MMITLFEKEGIVAQIGFCSKSSLRARCFTGRGNPERSEYFQILDCFAALRSQP
jgi:hypothetical protein